MFAQLAMIALAQMPQLTDCAARMPNYADWRERPGQTWDFAWPGQSAADLSIIGVEHTRNPEHGQFARLSAAIAAPGRRVAFYEGPDRGVASDLASTIRQIGESGAVRFLARQHGLETRSLEPHPAEQARRLLQRFPADRVMLFFVLRQAAQLRDREGATGEALDSMISQLLTRMQPLARAAGVAEPITDLAALERAAAQYWPSRNWRELPLSWFSPGARDEVTGGVFLGAINRADSEARDRHMFELIVASVSAGERPFVAVGRNHVPMLAPALACALARPE